MSEPGENGRAPAKPSDAAKPLAVRVDGFNISRLLPDAILGKLQVSFGTIHIGDICVHVVTKNKEGENEEEQVSFIRAEDEGAGAGTILYAEKPDSLRKALELLDQLSEGSAKA
jgi:hypothetical protein